MTKKQRSVSLCDHFKRSYGDRCKRKEDIVQGSDKKEDALSILSDCRKEKFGIAAHVRHRYFAQGKLLLRQAALFTERCSGGLLREKHGRNSFKSDCDVEELQFYFPTSKEKEN